MSPWVSAHSESATHHHSTSGRHFSQNDCAILFNSRADLELWASYLFKHLRRFGLMMYICVDTMLSKTESMCFPPPRVDKSNADTSHFGIRNGDGSTVCIVDITNDFKYFGSIIDTSLISDADVDRKIKAATSAFGALKNVLSCLSVDLRVKGKIYTALVLRIIFYGSEAWCLQEDLFNRLCSFHNRRVRSMCRITMAHTIKHHITSNSLFERRGVYSFDIYCSRRLLRWAGHVPRMPMDRIPHKLLTG